MYEEESIMMKPSLVTAMEILCPLDKELPLGHVIESTKSIAYRWTLSE
jgi:hypothetical protein